MRIFETFEKVWRCMVSNVPFHLYVMGWFFGFFHFGCRIIWRCLWWDDSFFCTAIQFPWWFWWGWWTFLCVDEFTLRCLCNFFLSQHHCLLITLIYEISFIWTITFHTIILDIEIIVLCGIKKNKKDAKSVDWVLTWYTTLGTLLQHVQ